MQVLTKSFFPYHHLCEFGDGKGKKKKGKQQQQKILESIIVIVFPICIWEVLFFLLEHCSALTCGTES